MDQQRLNELAELLRARREALGLSAREVARRANLDVGVFLRLEKGENPTPRLENLKAIGEVLGIPPADLYAAADALPAGQLPSLRPYMRARYRSLPDEALTKVELFIDDLARHYGNGLRGQDDER